MSFQPLFREFVVTFVAYAVRKTYIPCANFVVLLQRFVTVEFFITVNTYLWRVLSIHVLFKILTCPEIFITRITSVGGYFYDITSVWHNSNFIIYLIGLLESFNQTILHLQLYIQITVDFGQSSICFSCCF